MKEIKFRAWDKKQKNMYIPESFCWDGKITNGAWEGVELSQIEDQAGDGQIHSPSCCEIIGNIYEDSHLLEDKNGI